MGKFQNREAYELRRQSKPSNMQLDPRMSQIPRKTLSARYANIMSLGGIVIVTGAIIDVAIMMPKRRVG